MSLIVDLHIHSHYSRATSKMMDIENLYHWGKIKGINVIGTGDFTHPAWFKELQDKLEPAEPGLFKLKDKFAQKRRQQLPQSVRDNLIRFILTVEISNIYSKNGKVRKLHNLVIAPSFEVVAVINTALGKIGNIRADGRPILGLDSKELLKICLRASSDTLFIPAHIWTPWFSMFGSKSGFDSIEEAFEDLAGEIRVVETGLSSDPFMNWRIKNLDGLTLVSNSDAHSPAKLGREANVLNCPLDYYQIIAAIKTGDKRFVGTLEFFPQEGKYHYDGHRSCNVCLKPAKTNQYKGLCPKCHQPLVIGVDHRVDDLANRSADYRPKTHKQVEYVIPLTEILAEICNTKSSTTKKVLQLYEKLYSQFGDEFSILRTVPVKEMASGYPDVGQAINKLRQGKVHIKPGYDGVFGVVKVFADQQEKNQASGQIGLGW